MTTPPIVCYRHTDRVTRLSCSECGRPICAECSQDAAVGQRCPECAGPQQRTRVVRAGAVAHADMRTTPLTLVLMAINVAIFLAGRASPDLGSEILDRFAQHPILIDAGEWWRGLTAMFLHGGWLHLAANMYVLWLFGPTLERRFGTASYATLYLAAGLNGAALYHGLGSNNWAVGASGAIFGLFGAMIFLFYRQRHTRAGQAVFTQLLMWLAINLLIGFTVDGIAWEAHVGGLIAGGVIAYAWDRLPSDGPLVTLQRSIIGLCVAVAAVLVLILA